MKFKFIFVFLILVTITTGCVTEERINVKYNIDYVPGGDFQLAVNGYFHNFNDIRSSRKYSTDSFVKRVYSACTGDNPEEKTMNEMVKIYYKINKDSLQLKSVEVNGIEIREETKDVIISVSRTWENDEKDETNYIIVQENYEWKIDNRF